MLETEMSKRHCPINRNNKDVLFLLAFSMLHALVLFSLSNYSKKLMTYYDELLYYDVAKSIFSRGPLKVHGASIGIKNCLYPLLISPSFLVQNTENRIHVITFINSMIISSSIVAVYLICKELNVRWDYCLMGILIISVWPDMNFSATFMTENVYFPMVLFAVYFVIRYYKKITIVSSIIAAIFSFLVFFCKEVGLCMPLTFLCCETVLLLCELKKRRDERKHLLKHRIICIVAYCVTFLVLFLIISIIFKYSDNRPVYTGIFDRFLIIIKSPYQICYLLYLVIYYLFTSMLSFFLLPVLISIVYIKKMNPLNKKISFFCMVFLLVCILVIVVDSGVRENLGNEVVRVHLRYYFPLVGVLLPLTFSFFSVDVNDSGKFKNIANSWKVGFIALTFCLLTFFKGVSVGSAVDSSAMSYVTIARKKVFKDLTASDPASMTFHLGAIVSVSVIIILFLFGVFLANRRSIKTGVYYFGIMAFTISIINLLLSYRIIKKDYYIDKIKVNEMSEINDYLIAQKKPVNVMFISNDKGWGTPSKMYDTYIDTFGEEYTIDITNLSDWMNGDSYTELVGNSVFEETVRSGKGYNYSVDRIDYFITDSTEYVESVVDEVERIEELGGEDYYLYRNIDPYTVKKGNVTGERVIKFSSVGNNASEYVLSGISTCDGDYSWTNDDEVKVSLRKFNFENEDTVSVIMDISDTYNGKQRYIITKGDEYLTNGSIEGTGEIRFLLPVSEEGNEFVVLLPDADSPHNINGSDDDRKLALALRSITIESE